MEWSQWSRWLHWLFKGSDDISQEAHQQDQAISTLKAYYQEVQRLYQRISDADSIDISAITNSLASYGRQGDMNTQQLSRGAIRDVQDEYDTNQKIQEKSHRMTDWMSRDDSSSSLLDDSLHQDLLLSLENLKMEIQMKEQEERFRAFTTPHDRVIQVIMMDGIIAFLLTFVGIALLFLIWGPATSHSPLTVGFWVLSAPSGLISVVLPFTPTARVRKLLYKKW